MDHKTDRNINQEHKTEDHMGNCEKRDYMEQEKAEQKDSEAFETELRQLVKLEVLEKEPMAGHVTFRVGGPADYYVRVSDAKELKAVIALCRERQIPWFVLGNGSNLLVGDGGIRGVVLEIQRDYAEVKVEGTKITAQAGALLSKIAAVALREHLTGFEFAAGIPGTIGGACVMNAGAYGGELKDVLKEVKVMTPEGEEKSLPAEELQLGYRTSVIPEKGYIVLEATLELKEGKQEEIKAVMDDLKERRIDKQPLEYPSAGSTFKRPEGYFAGKLIQDAGLRGFQVGGAQVAEKHCGFVINKDHATAADILELICQVQKKVQADFGVQLETEVKKIGEF